MNTETTTEDKLLDNMSTEQLLSKLFDSKVKIILADYSIYLIELAMKGKIKDSLSSAIWYDKVYKKQ